MSTLLIVDDNPIDRERVERLLCAEHHCLGASTGGEGVEVCRRTRPECVLLDYRLPDHDGVVWLPHFLEQNVGVVVLTGAGDESVASACLRGGAHDYLSKDELTRENLARAVRNATEKAQLLGELDLHHRIVSAMPIGVAVFGWSDRSDVDSLSLLWRNAAAELSASLDPAKLGRPLRELLPELLTTPLPQLLADTIVSGCPRTLPEISIQDAYYRVNTAPLGNDKVAALFENITAQRAASEEHRKMEAQMRAAQRLEALGRLAGGVAHDFNNVLTIIDTFARFIRDDAGSSSPTAEDADSILDATARAANLTRQLLALGRRQVQELRIVNLNEVVNEVQRMLQRLIGEDIELVTHFDHGLFPVEADPTHIEQVVLNLAVNARDAMPNGGQLVIETANVHFDEQFELSRGIKVPPGSYALVSVSDTGCGMTEQVQEQIFEPFFTTKSESGGTGLGLSTVFGIVEQSGGYVRVYSEVGHGSTFKIYLPAAAAESVALPTSKRPPPRDLSGCETVLVVEDDPLVRAAVHRSLSKHGYRVLEAAGGDEAFEIAKQHPDRIHLLLTDVVMPNIGGVELARKLCAQHPLIKVVYMSGYTGHALVHRALLVEGAAIVQKPFTPVALISRIRAALDGEGVS